MRPCPYTKQHQLCEEECESCWIYGYRSTRTKTFALYPQYIQDWERDEIETVEARKLNAQRSIKANTKDNR